MDDVIRRECSILEELFDFVCNLVQGPDICHKNSSEDLVKIKSVCSDLIYIVSKGRVKPVKISCSRVNNEVDGKLKKCSYDIK